jgi:hypothetical protein
MMSEAAGQYRVGKKHEQVDRNGSVSPVYLLIDGYTLNC